MTVPTQADVDEATREALFSLASCDLDVLGEAMKFRERWQENSAFEQPAPAGSPAPPPAAAPPAAAASSPLMDELNQLADLHRRGVLSDDEFTSAKAKLLGS